LTSASGLILRNEPAAATNLVFEEVATVRTCFLLYLLIALYFRFVLSRCSSEINAPVHGVQLQPRVSRALGVVFGGQAGNTNYPVSRDEFPSHDGNCFCGRGVFLVDSCSASLAISQFVSDLSPKVLKQLLVSSDHLLSLLSTRLSEPNHSSSGLHQTAGDMLL
jgi:hypothetical protein